MALTRETTTINPTYNIGDVKLANYDISFTLNQLVEPETGWFLLNGAVISQTTYPLLYARFGSTFNTGGEGTGNFRLPNYSEGKFPVGRGLTNFTTYGASGGEINHTLTSPAEIPVHGHTDTLNATANSHGHTGGLSAVSGGDHGHSYTHGTIAAAAVAGTTSVVGATSPFTSGGGGASHAHTVTSGPSFGSTTETYTKSGSVSSAGSGGGHNNMMPYIVIGGLLVKHD